MRVMYLSPSGQLGGAETCLLEILAAVRRAQPTWPLHVVVASDGPLRARAAALGVATTELTFPHPIARLGETGAAQARAGYFRLGAQLSLAVPAVAGYIARLRALIREFQPDIVHTNGLKMHVLGAWASHNRAIVWHVHDYLGSRPLTVRLLRSLSARCRVIVANSKSVAEDTRKALSNRLQVVAIHNAIDLDRFTQQGPRLNLDALSGLPCAATGTVRVGLVGTFARWKGHTTFLNAMARVPRDLPLRGYIVGDALYQTDASQYSREELMRVARNLGLEGRVGFTGYTDRPEQAMRALDIVVHASTAPEPFGLVIAEAMACGRAVVVSHAGGAAELVTPGVDALAHDPGDVDGLADRIVDLATDANLRARLGAAARENAERRFAPARLSSELLSVYRVVTEAAA